MLLVFCYCRLLVFIDFVFVAYFVCCLLVLGLSLLLVFALAVGLLMIVVGVCGGLLGVTYLVISLYCLISVVCDLLMPVVWFVCCFCLRLLERTFELVCGLVVCGLFVFS